MPIRFDHLSACSVLFAGVLALLFGVGCEQPNGAITQTGPEVSPGQARMEVRLDEIRRQAMLDHPFFEMQTLSQLEIELSSLPAGQDDRKRLQIHFDLSRAYARLGELDQATEHAMQAAELLASLGNSLGREAQVKLLYGIGLVYFQFAEARNCLYCRNTEVCLIPIGEGAHYTSPEGSRKAKFYLEEVLKRDPENLRAKWLLNIAAMTLKGYPESVPEPFRLPADAFASAAEFPRFTDVALSTGVRVISCGGGAIAEDFDGDHLIDVMTCSSDPSMPVRYLQNTGNGTWSDRGKDTGLSDILGGINLVQADFDNDGKIDVLVLRGGGGLPEHGRYPLSLLKNRGGGQFQDVTYDVGLGTIEQPSQTGAWADFDNDGDVDLFVGREGAACELYRNDRERGFVKIADAAGVADVQMTKAVVWGDYNNDRFPDLYVSNFGGDNRLYRNNGNGAFTDVAEMLGMTGPVQGGPAWFWDVNNDGRLDLFAASCNPGVEHTAAFYFGLPRTDQPDHLYMQQEDGTFRESAKTFGIDRETQPLGANFGDLDNDGYEDFSLGTGGPGFEDVMPNLMFHNQDGQRFEDVTTPGGFGHIQKGHAVVFADLDNDGDQDVFQQMGGVLPGDWFGDALYENPGFQNHWIRIRLIGETSNRSGIGARIRCDVQEGDVRRSIYKWVNSGGSFGANSLSPQIGLGKATTIERLEIYWPTSDLTQTFENIPADRFIEVREGQSDYQAIELKSSPFRKFSVR